MVGIKVVQSVFSTHQFIRATVVDAVVERVCACGPSAATYVHLLRLLVDTHPLDMLKQLNRLKELFQVVYRLPDATKLVSALAKVSTHLVTFMDSLVILLKKGLY